MFFTLAGIWTTLAYRADFDTSAYTPFRITSRRSKYKPPVPPSRNDRCFTVTHG